MACTTFLFSLVLFKHSLVSIKPFLASVKSLVHYASTNKSRFRFALAIYDGSPSSFLSPSENELKLELPSFELFYERGSNIGFGAANNRNFFRSCLSDSDYIVIVNPDISFSPDQLYPLFEWAVVSKHCSCVAPLIMSPNGNIQYSAKMNPTFLSLLLGRLGCLRIFPFFRSYDIWHKNMNRDYTSEVISSTYLSGCFLLVPQLAFSAVGGFCDKYFLHVEDADIVRRLSAIGLTLHNPIGVVEHGWARGSHTSLRQVLSLIRSYFIYCQTWGFRLI